MRVCACVRVCVCVTSPIKTGGEGAGRGARRHTDELSLRRRSGELQSAACCQNKDPLLFWSCTCVIGAQKKIYIYIYIYICVYIFFI